MIVRIPHPALPNVQVFQPVYFEIQAGAWRSLCAPGTFFYQAIDAARVCLIHALRTWQTLVEEIRVLRALCEHPLFDFQRDGVDSEMVQRFAKRITKRIEAITRDLAVLLHEPGEDDEIMIGGERLRVDNITGALPHLSGLEHTIRSGAQALDFGSPDELFPLLVAQSLSLAGKMSGAPVTRHGVTNGLTWLIEYGLPEVDRALAAAEAEAAAAAADDN